MTASPDYTQEWLDHGGARLGFHSYPEPDHDAASPVVVVLPAMGVPAGYYRRFAMALRAEGLAVVVADHRGTGASTPPAGRGCTYGYAELVDDVGALLDELRPRFEGRTTVLLGHSMGGQLALLHAALSRRTDVAGIVLVASGTPYWRAYPGLRGYGVLPFTMGIFATSTVLRVWPGWGFGGRQSRGVIRDWAYVARTGRFPALRGADAEAALRQLGTPVLAVSVEADEYAPDAAVDHLWGKLTAAPVRRERYTAAQAGGPVDHFAWVRAGRPLAGRIATFAAELRARATD